MSLSIEEVAQGFSSIGSEPRLEVLLALVRAGRKGLNVGGIQQRVNIPASTLAHHIRFLAAAGLVEQEKVGREVINRAAFERMQALADFLMHECCIEEGNCK